jgi:hypothetical protein
MKTKLPALLLLLMTATQSFAQPADREMPRIVNSQGHYSLLVDGKPYFIFGGQIHNSSAWPAMMPGVWDAAATLHLNTVEAPVYWEQLEPLPGRFNYAVVDSMLLQARRHQVRLVLLWFGTWKNGSNHYMPAWMKEHPGKYPNIVGKNGQSIDSPSPFSEATLNADIAAFTALMHHLKIADALHTVIMVQVENESGSWGSVRDYSPEAQKLFDGPVPAALLAPELLEALNRPTVTSGAWRQVFGARADEYFQAWSVASFIGKVASAGKAAYPLPLYVNAALRDPLTDPTAENYESGGPTDNVIPIWKAAALAIDLLAPDIYLDGSDRILKVLDLYSRPDNALLVPEVGLTPERAKYLYEVLARGGIGFSPFGIDDNGSNETPGQTRERLRPFAADDEVLTPMMAELAKWAADGRIKAAVEREDHKPQVIDLGAWQATVDFGIGEREVLEPNAGADGRLMIIQLDKGQYLVIGAKCHIKFQPSGSNAGKPWQYLAVEEGSYVRGEFKVARILNGDETDWGGPHFGSAVKVLRISLVTR